MVSAPQRLLDLASPPRKNDTLRTLLTDSQSLLTTDFVSQVLDNNKRFAIINVWRNIAESPVLSHPLALCDGQTMSQPAMPCLFSFHAAFVDPTTPADAPDRQSIEVRCIVVFDA